jgi:hypothetical protein
MMDQRWTHDATALGAPFLGERPIARPCGHPVPQSGRLGVGQVAARAGHSGAVSRACRQMAVYQSRSDGQRH